MKLTGLNSWKSWGIAAAVSFVNCLVLLPLRISGLLYVAWIPRYHTTREYAVQPIIISYLLRCVCGPLVGFLIEVIEIRTVYTVGSIIAALGIGICFFAESTTFLVIFFGVVYGLGFASVNSFLPHIVKQHFDKHVTKANGVTYMGTCLSALFISPLGELWLKTFGVTETFLIMSGIMLQGVPIAMFLKDPKYRQRTVPQTKDSNTDSATVKECSPSTSEDAEVEDVSENATSANTIDITFKDCETEYTGNKKLNLETMRTKKEKGAAYVLVANNQSSEEIQNSNDISESKSSTNIDSCNKASPAHKNVSKCKTAFYSLRVLGHPPYLFIMFGYSFLAFVVTVIPSVIVDAAIDIGIPESKGMYFLMLIPVAEFFGSISLAWIVDRGYLAPCNMISISFLCLALSCCSLSWATAFHSLMIGVLCMGFFSYNIFVVNPALVYEFVPKAQHSVAITSRMLLFVPFSFATSPLIGYFRVGRGSYDGIFYIMAIGCVVCAVLMFSLPHFARFVSSFKKEVQKDVDI